MVTLTGCVCQLRRDGERISDLETILGWEILPENWICATEV